MLGKFFIEIGNESQLLSQGLVETKVGDNMYLCRFATPAGGVPVSQVTNLTRMQSFVLFDTQEDLQTWLKQMSTPPAPPEGDQRGDHAEGDNEESRPQNDESHPQI
jgi:hypothetical protein